jgi:hypothetical protein
VFLAVCDNNILDRLIPGGAAHFLDEQDAIALLFLQEVSIGDNGHTYKN